MTPADDRLRAQRDRALARSHRVRLVVVTGGVVGSLAVAGGVALAEPKHSTSGRSLPSTPPAAEDGGSSSQWQPDDGSQDQSDPWAQPQAPRLGPGSGTPDGHSAGS